MVLCPLCSVPDREAIRCEANKTLVRCKKCRFMYVLPQPTETELKALYDECYFDGAELDSFLAYRAPVFRQCLDRVASMGAGRRLLDIGCGTGEFVQAAIARGWRAEGLEAAAPAAHYAKQVAGLPVHHGDIYTSALAPRSYDVITMLDVLEHLLDPRSVVTRVWELLSPGGVFVVRVPNASFQLQRAKFAHILGLNDSGMEMRYHLNHFTPNTLENLLRSASFAFEAVEIGAPETKAHARWATPALKREYYRCSELLLRLSSINIGNIIVAFAQRPVEV